MRQLLHQPNTEQLRSLLGSAEHIFIDEAQRIPTIGLELKIITDQFPQKQLYVSGSSAFELSDSLNEPLTGRKWQYELLPISWAEFEARHGYLVAEQQLPDRLVYGFYPEVLNNSGDEREVLRNLVSSYLCRDVLALAKIRKSEVLEKLVLALALQVGSEVNHNELAQTVGVDKNTVANYIDVLVKGYVLFSVGGATATCAQKSKRTRRYISGTMACATPYSAISTPYTCVPILVRSGRTS